MSTEKRLQWLTALRSGSYKQGKRFLHRGDQFCCLGVACDLNKDILGVKDLGVHVEYDGYHSILPPPLQQMLGLDYGTLDFLMRENDNGMSFTSIAAYLEKYFESH